MWIVDNLSYDSIAKEGMKEGRTGLSSKMVEEVHKLFDYLPK